MGSKDTVRCGECDRLLDEPASTVPSERQPCPECGSLKRTFDLQIAETVDVEVGLGLKHKRPGRKRPVAEEVRRSELFRDTGERRYVERVIDRSDPDPEKWRYREKITDKRTGEVVREVDERLKNHVGRGAAEAARRAAHTKQRGLGGSSQGRID